MLKNHIPDRWLPYKAMGDRIKGTPFIAFKVPLSKAINDKVSPEERFSPSKLLELCPNLSLVLDLTNTSSSHYYDKNEFLNKKINYIKLNCRGHEVPSFQVVKKFFNIVDSFLKRSKPDDLIGVHCTHGVNRTGYMICRYMIQRLGINPKVAIAEFAAARGYPIERQNYIKNLGSNLREVPETKSDEVFVLNAEVTATVDKDDDKRSGKKRRNRRRDPISDGHSRPEQQNRYQSNADRPPRNFYGNGRSYRGMDQSSDNFREDAFRPGQNNGEDSIRPTFDGYRQQSYRRQNTYNNRMDSTRTSNNRMDSTRTSSSKQRGSSNMNQHQYSSRYNFESKNLSRNQSMSKPVCSSNWVGNNYQSNFTDPHVTDSRSGLD